MSSPGLTQWQLTFELSPIVLVNGIAQGIPGGMMPIISLTQGASFKTGLLSGSSATADDFFAHFRPVSGAELVKQAIGEYAFANQAVAGNAVIAQPLTFALLMICPAKGAGGYAQKLTVISALKAALDQHNILGGTYNVALPNFYYTNCLLTDLQDVDEADTKQPQVVLQWNFRKPLISLADAQAAQNSLMSKISGGQQITGQPTLSGGSATTGSPTSQATPPTVPAAQGVGAAGTVSPSSPAPAGPSLGTLA